MCLAAARAACSSSAACIHHAAAERAGCGPLSVLPHGRCRATQCCACFAVPCAAAAPCSLIESELDLSWEAGKVESESRVVVRGFNFLAWLMQVLGLGGARRRGQGGV